MTLCKTLEPDEPSVQQNMSLHVVTNSFENTHSSPLSMNYAAAWSVCVCLTLAVFGVHGISIITRLADLTVSPSCVAEATQTLPSDCVTVSRLTDVHIAVTLTANT